mmetsp:Transcript_3381/g.4260  ORF Transcript_3381/g.4260 Transcript_3381/m.4260 type:complete len:325 (-) Transcript_3381:1339-2313(-)|eukprot:CAMPEP_0204887074 /NCGR_PEP_ID=MMETSP1349-20130617/16756_1 /ASSEMBLY_ACC=CAM_ASM_000710 /TAXON_ID=215587 /ORGANISM="Aplanochytrium stocchinoi, Strain GSBS06" /LENGTH=324 /DNA_ID=CAMNT_0052049555 /DNA_START=141 /DNA_END=1115 /DNA_ORIENTATION=+
MNFCAVGVCVIDNISVVQKYPKEDEELRCISRSKICGGNAANLCKVISQYPHLTARPKLIYTSTKDEFIYECLKLYKIDPLPIILENGQVPESHILQSLETGSRTIIHYRDLEEVTFENFEQMFTQHHLNEIDWFHFEGRNSPETERMIKFVRDSAAASCSSKSNVRISMEIEKHRGDGEMDILRLAKLVDVVIFSKAYANLRGHSDPVSFLSSIVDASWQSETKMGEKHLIIAWGTEGAYGVTVNFEIMNQIQNKSRSISDFVVHQKAFAPKVVVDTLGAGDAFNAGLLADLYRNNDIGNGLKEACLVAGIKCGQCGFENIVN